MLPVCVCMHFHLFICLFLMYLPVLRVVPPGSLGRRTARLPRPGVQVRPHSHSRGFGAQQLHLVVSLVLSLVCYVPVCSCCLFFLVFFKGASNQWTDGLDQVATNENL